jgi:branched-chain amino acid transport system ATP-binding protein
LPGYEGSNLGGGGGARAGDVAIELTDLTTGYGGVAVVHDLSLQVRYGTVTALLGANGAGKTTTLMAIAGERPLTGGRIHVAVQDRAGLSCHEVVRRGVALVPASRGLGSELTVQENLRLYCSKRGEIARVLRLFPALAPLSGRRAGLLSGGEQQMLALACAMSTRPRILLIDELSHGLAPLVVEALLPMVLHLAVEGGAAVLLVEQRIDAALRVASYAYVMKRGRLELSDETAALRRDVARLEASYLGDGRPAS